MNKTAKQPARDQATNQHPTPITDRPHEVYHKRTALDKLILVVVITIALVVIALSFSNTALLARELGLNEYLTAGLVEILFASLLFIRGRQRATQRNVPFFLTAGYFVSLGFVTGVNMWGLSLENPTIGPIVGIAISGSMWLMESTLVWLWTASHQPHKKSAKELEREAKREIEEIKIMQKIAWMRWEAQKPSLDLIRKARKEEERRKEVVGDKLPAFFDTQVKTVTSTTTNRSNTNPIGEVDTTRKYACEDITTTGGKGGGTSITRYINESTNEVTTGDIITTSNEGTSNTSNKYGGTTRGRCTTTIGEGDTSENATTSINTSATNATSRINEDNTSEGTRSTTTRNKDGATSKEITSDTTNTNDGAVTSTNEDITTSSSTTKSVGRTSTSGTNEITTTKKKSTSARKKNTTNKKTIGHLRLVNPDLSQVKNVALAIYEKEGKLPGRPRLQKEAQCKENHARRVLAELKEQLEAI